MNRKRLLLWLRYVVGLGLGVAALFAVSGDRGELIGATTELSRLNYAWCGAAIASEAISLVAFARLQARLLRAARVRIGRPRILGVTLAASAMASSIPAGPAVASVYAFRQYRRAGADDSVAGWTLVATLLFSALGLAVLAAAGVLIAEREGTALDLVGVTLSILVVTAIATIVFSQRQVLGRAALFSIKVCKRLTRYPRGEAEEHLRNVANHLGQVHLTLKEFGPAMACSIGNWSADCGALALSYVALGAGVPWRGLLLAYGAGQLASNLPITPGGLGVVEGSLTVALVAFGGLQISTVAAVILYRLISFWGLLPVGWLSWGVLALRDRRKARRLVPDAGGGGPGWPGAAVASAKGTA